MFEELSDQERTLLRWGGIAGILSGVTLLITSIVLFGFVPKAPTSALELVMRYPDVRIATIVGETFSLAGVFLSIAFFIALYRALRGTSYAPALYAVGLSLFGLAILAVEGVPDVAYAKISDLFHAPGATAQDQATLALIWKTTQGLFSQYDTASFVFLALGYVAFGFAMLRNLAFGKRFGIIAIVLGLAGLVGVYALGITSSAFAPLGLFILIILPILLGWKLYSLSKAASPA